MSPQILLYQTGKVPVFEETTLFVRINVYGHQNPCSDSENQTCSPLFHKSKMKNKDNRRDHSLNSIFSEQGFYGYNSVFE